MFTARYFNPRYWASRYWAKIGGAPSLTVPDTFGVTGVIKATIGVSSPDISKGQGVSGKITNTIGVSGKI